jgi:hypothetical protein
LSSQAEEESRNTAQRGASPWPGRSQTRLRKFESDRINAAAFLFVMAARNAPECPAGETIVDWRSVLDF